MYDRRIEFVVIFTNRAWMMATTPCFVLHTVNKICSVTSKVTTATRIGILIPHVCVRSPLWKDSTMIINVQTQPIYSYTQPIKGNFQCKVYYGKWKLSLFQHLQVCINTHPPPHQSWTCQLVNMHTSIVNTCTSICCTSTSETINKFMAYSINNQSTMHISLKIGLDDLHSRLQHVKGLK